MAANFLTTFSNAFSWKKIYKFRSRFHWSLFPGVQLTIFQHRFRYWLGADQVTSHYLNQLLLVYWHIYASSGLNALMKKYPVVQDNRLMDSLLRITATYFFLVTQEQNSWVLPNVSWWEHCHAFPGSLVVLSLKVMPLPYGIVSILSLSQRLSLPVLYRCCGWYPKSQHYTDQNIYEWVAYWLWIRVLYMYG